MNAHPPMPSVLYQCARQIVRCLLHLLFRFRVVGTEHIPATGPLVLGSNHISNFDPIVIGASTFRQVRFMAKEELFKNRAIGSFLKYLGAFQVKRGLRDTAAIRYAIEIPHQGGCVVVFPEGHRSMDGQLGPGMPGVALIARKAEAPIVPVAIIGPYRFRRRLTVRFGPALFPESDDTNETLLEKLMLAIDELLRVGH